MVKIVILKAANTSQARENRLGVENIVIRLLQFLVEGLAFYTRIGMFKRDPNILKPVLENLMVLKKDVVRWDLEGPISSGYLI